MMTQEMSKAAGTPMYMSPEILNGGAYSFSADTYSFAFIVWEIFSRKLPYGDMIPWEITKHVVESAMRPEPLNDPMDVLSVRCWAQDPQKRPSFFGILAYLKALQSCVRLNGPSAFAEACTSQLFLLDKTSEDSGSRSPGGGMLSAPKSSFSSTSPRVEPASQQTSSKSILNLLPLRKTGESPLGRKSFGEKSKGRTNSSGSVELTPPSKGDKAGQLSPSGKNDTINL
jgi:serine/threonine protein kinase